MYSVQCVFCTIWESTLYMYITFPSVSLVCYATWTTGHTLLILQLSFLKCTWSPNPHTEVSEYLQNKQDRKNKMCQQSKTCIFLERIVVCSWTVRAVTPIQSVQAFASLSTLQLLTMFIIECCFLEFAIVFTVHSSLSSSLPFSGLNERVF